LSGYRDISWRFQRSYLTCKCRALPTLSPTHPALRTTSQPPLCQRPRRPNPPIPTPLHPPLPTSPPPRQNPPRPPPVPTSAAIRRDLVESGHGRVFGTRRVFAVDGVDEGRGGRDEGVVGRCYGGDDEVG
jgi:hypothetical protein